MSCPCAMQPALRRHLAPALCKNKVLFSLVEIVLVNKFLRIKVLIVCVNSGETITFTRFSSISFYKAKLIVPHQKFVSYTNLTNLCPHA